VNLRRIVDILERNAAQRSDPYLRSLARTLERLSTDIAEARIDRPRLPRTQYAPRARGAGLRRSVRQTRMLTTKCDRTVAVRANDIKGDRQNAETTARRRRLHADNPRSPNRQRDQLNAGPPANNAARRPNISCRRALKRLGVDIFWLLVDEDGNEVDPRSQVERPDGGRRRSGAWRRQPAGSRQPPLATPGAATSR